MSEPEAEVAEGSDVVQSRPRLVAIDAKAVGVSVGFRHTAVVVDLGADDDEAAGVPKGRFPKREEPRNLLSLAPRSSEPALVVFGSVGPSPSTPAAHNAAKAGLSEKPLRGEPLRGGPPSLSTVVLSGNYFQAPLVIKGEVEVLASGPWSLAWFTGRDALEDSRTSEST
jgi:hypothetical protein